MSEPLLEDFRSYLTERGYCPVTVHRYAAGAAQFLVWLGEHPPEERCLDAAAVRRFLEAASVAGDRRAGPTRRPSKDPRAESVQRTTGFCSAGQLGGNRVELVLGEVRGQERGNGLGGSRQGQVL